MRARNIRHTLLVATLLAAGCHGADIPSAGQEPRAGGEVPLPLGLVRSGQVRIEAVATSNETLAIRTTGKVGFNEERLGYVSAPLVGRVVEVRARPGEHVDAGQTLAVIDSADLGQASSEFIKARADMILAERAYTLAQELIASKAMARKDYQKAEDEFVKAKADLRRTRERLVSLGVPETELAAGLDALHVRSQLHLTAAISGTVVERSLTLGQMVGGDSAQRLFVIADLNTLWVTADIYEKDLSLVHAGQDVRVQATAWPQEQFDGRIDYVSDTVDAATRTIKVRASVDNHQMRLKPEMFVTATVQTGTNATVLTVPLASVHGEGSGQTYVFALRDDTHVVRRPVTLGAKMDDRVTITAGLAADERVVTSGSILLKAEADRQADNS